MSPINDAYTKGTPELKGLSPLIAVRPTFLDGTKTAGLRDYELTDHLSNVMAVISDRKISVDTNNDNITDYYAPQMISFTDYYPFGFPIAERSGNLAGYRFGFNGQEGDNEVYGAKQSYTAEFWQYDTRLGRRWNVDPKGNAMLGSYVAFENNPICYNDRLGDTIKNAVSNIVNQKTQVRDNAQSKYDELISTHHGDLKNRDIQKYKRESGLKNAENELAYWEKIESKINSMIETFQIVMPDEFNYLNSLSTNILIGYSSKMGPYGENNPQTTMIPAEEMTIMQYGENISSTFWTGNIIGDIQITLYGGGVFNPFQTNYLANEFGDIDYFFKNGKPNDPISFQKWKITANAKYSGYWDDSTGAGQMSFRYQNTFEEQFNDIRKNYPVNKIDSNNWIIR